MSQHLDQISSHDFEPTPRSLNPTRLRRPAFTLNVPFSFSVKVANNRWMQEMSPGARTLNQDRAMLQFLELYRYVSSEALVYLLPTPRDCNLQDLVFTANLGLVPEHYDGGSAVIISNFTSEPRYGESAVGAKFFADLGYDVHVAPHKFEGEADLKHLYDNIYVGGYGMRSELAAYEWMERTFDMQIVKVRLQDDYLYHLDCSIFPVTREDTLVCTEAFEDEEIAALEKVTNIIDVSEDDCYSGLTNSVRLTNTILNGSNLLELKAGTEDYAFEVKKNRRLEDIATELGFDVAYFNLSEFLKGGALLSCMMMHLNRQSYEITLTT
ncbi:MAG: dimethylarginine dimethylaminohydrolase family protein [Candidatus Eiseniibacteriota bacterium]